MEHKEPDLSVIILTHNTRELTRACVRSVLADAEAFPYTVEVIIVDNASTDDTAATLSTEFPGVRLVINSTNLGFARGNNVGLEAAQGRYLLLLNSDTEVQPGALARLVEFMETHPDAGACGPMLLNPDASLQPSGGPLPSIWSVFLGMSKLYRLWKRDWYIQIFRDYSQVVRVGQLSGAALLVRREVYERVGGLDPNFFAYYEDVDWCKRIGDAGYALYYVPTAKIMHHWKVTSRMISELSYRAGQDSLRYYFAKHHGRLAHACIQVMLMMKEVVLLVRYTFQHNRPAQQFHRRMLARACARVDLPDRKE